MASSEAYDGLLELPSKTLHVRVSGSSAGSAVLFIHGLGSSGNFWDAVIDYGNLDSSHRVIRIDFEGAGLSPLSSTSLSIDSLAADAIDVLDALKIGRATVVGHSMGGLIVSTLAAKYPDRIEKLVLVGAITAPNETVKTVMRARAEKAKSEGMFALADAVPTAAFSKYSKAHRRLAYAFVRQIVGGQNPTAYAAACTAIVDSREPNYSAIKAPTLVIAGNEDPMSNAQTTARFQREIASCEAKTLEQCGHWLSVEDPEGTAEALKSFLSK